MNWLDSITINVTIEGQKFYCPYCGVETKMEKFNLYKCEKCGRFFLLGGDMIKVI